MNSRLTHAQITKTPRYIKSHRVTPVIPFKRVYLSENSESTPEDFYDVKLYRKRNIIERFFGRLKENKRIAMRFDKMAHSFLSFIALAIPIFLNYFVNSAILAVP